MLLLRVAPVYQQHPYRTVPIYNVKDPALHSRETLSLALASFCLSTRTRRTEPRAQSFQCSLVADVADLFT